MCGRSLLGKPGDLVVGQRQGAVADDVMTAGHNALRGSGPDQTPAFDNAMAHVGCPDRRIDRLCITCCSPSQPSHHAGCPARSRLPRKRDGFLVAIALGHHGPGHSRNLVGKRDGGNLGRPSDAWCLGSWRNGCGRRRIDIRNRTWLSHGYSNPGTRVDVITSCLRSKIETNFVPTVSFAGYSRYRCPTVSTLMRTRPPSYAPVTFVGHRPPC